MKKLISILAALALVLSMSLSAFAAAPDTAARGGQCAGFVDADGDGVCDNRGTGRGAGFVDEDGDGVCDNQGTCAMRRGARSAR